MAWYRCDVDNQYDGATVYRRGNYYDLQGTPPAAFFTADTDYASRTTSSIGGGLLVDADGNVTAAGNFDALGGTVSKAGTAVISQAEADSRCRVERVG